MKTFLARVTQYPFQIASLKVSILAWSLASADFIISLDFVQDCLSVCIEHDTELIAVIQQLFIYQENHIIFEIKHSQQQRHTSH